jgi:hypothetical protein
LPGARQFGDDERAAFDGLIFGHPEAKDIRFPG